MIDYLRISITGRCNLSCVYCKPLDRADASPEPGLLAAEEIETVVRCAVDVGFRKFRLTGGEPTMRRDVVEVVRRIGSVEGVAGLAMTTNGMRMRELARPLRAAGLARVNVHLDTLSVATLPRLMRRGEVTRILDGILACEEAGLVPVKLNAVVVRGMNDREVEDLARLTLERAWHVRFVELMPLGAGDEARTSLERFVGNPETRARIEAAFGSLEAIPKASESDECDSFRIAGAKGLVGFISPVSRPYCGACSRMRLTADGRLHMCLLDDAEIDVRGALRADVPLASRLDGVRAILRRAVGSKPMGHRLGAGIHTKTRRMHQVGG